MTAEELVRWLEEHASLLFTFMDYEAYVDEEEELARTLTFWFDDEDWNRHQDRFLHLGTDGRGSQFAIWIRPGHDPSTGPVVYFGSEGGAGVLASTPQDWAKVLAHAPGIAEYPRPSTLDPALNWMLEEDNREDAYDPGEDPRECLAAYRAAVEERFGEIPTLASLTKDLDTLNKEFMERVEEPHNP